jgi:hypothetical protein
MRQLCLRQVLSYVHETSEICDREAHVRDLDKIHFIFSSHLLFEQDELF